jgi:putative salt-induced outer membrane protein
MKIWKPVAVAWLAVLAAGLSLAQEAAPEEDPWAGSLGLSYLATTGNSETSNLGVDLAFKRKPEPWGWDLALGLVRAEDTGVTTAERYFARARAERALASRWTLFAGANGEKDQFAGFDLRAIAEAGVKYTALAGPAHELSFDGGATWTTEDPTHGESYDYFGAVLGLAYTWNFSPTAALSERLLYYPNFDDSSDWRVTSETAIKAALTTRLALKVGYSIRFDNSPVPGFEDTDTATTLSLVVSL